VSSLTNAQGKERGKKQTDRRDRNSKRQRGERQSVIHKLELIPWRRQRGRQREIQYDKKTEERLMENKGETKEKQQRGSIEGEKRIEEKAGSAIKREIHKRQDREKQRR
jgi:hypothetical protein